MRGELWLKSDCVMKGYLNDEDATKETLDEDGWYRTGKAQRCREHCASAHVSLGDVVYFDADGFYYVVDRLKDMIKVNGLQVSPSQLVRRSRFSAETDLTSEAETCDMPRLRR